MAYNFEISELRFNMKTSALDYEIFKIRLGCLAVFERNSCLTLFIFNPAPQLQPLDKLLRI